MRLFKKSNSTEGLRRLPMLPELDASGLPEYADGSWCADDGGVNYMELVYQNMHIDPTRPNEIHSIPDMLKRSTEFARRMLSDDPALFRQPVNEWLGTLCAIALADEGAVRRVDIDLIAIAKDDEAPFFLRALAKNLREQEPPVTELTLFMHRADDIVTDDVPIAFSYPGLPILLCPAAEISHNLSETGPKWFEWTVYEDITTEGRPRRYRGLFKNPIMTLRQPEYLDKATALYAGLSELAGEYPALGLRLKEILMQLPHADDILSGYRLRTDLLPQLSSSDETKAADDERALVETWFSDRLCLFHLRKNTREDGGQGATSFESCYGNHQVVAKRDGAPLCEAMLPLSHAFVEYLHTLSPQEEARVLEGLRDNIRIVCNDSTPQSYLLTFQWNGREYPKLYTQGMYTHLRDMDRRYVPMTAVWPCMDDAKGKWNHYYLYYSYDIEDSWDLSFRVLTGNGERAAQWDRNSGLVGTYRDFVIESESFPRYVAVYEGASPVGLLLIKPAGQVAGPVGEERVIGLDYGTTSTIAYYKNANDGSAANEYILPDQVLPVSGIMDDTMAQRMTLDFANLRSIGSALYMSLLHVHGSAAGVINPFEMSNILFALKLQLDDDMKDRIFMNLKLSNQRSDLEKIRAYLRQAIMMYMWDSYRSGISKIYWRFSYPRSISPEMVSMFKSNIVGILKDLSYGEYGCEFRTEAEAIGSFITAPTLMTKIMENHWDAVSSSAGYLCMDIGGGTVDFSLWQKQGGSTALCAEASLLNLAGNFILCDTITHELDQGVKPRVELLREILHGKKGNLLEMVDILDRLTAPSVERDKLFKRFKMLWATHIGEISQSIEAHHLDLGLDECVNLRGYLNMIELYLCLLFYFAGLMVGAAVREGRFEIREGETFSILLTGNGARMLELLPEGTADSFREGQLYKRLGVSFFSGQNIANALKLQIISPFMAKHEVSYGLTHQNVQSFARDGQGPGNSALGDLLAGVAAMEREADLQPEGHEGPKNLQFIETRMTTPEGKEALAQLFDTFWKVLGYAKEHTGDSFPGFISTLYKASTVQEMSEKTRSIITALDDDPNEYSNNMAGMFARTARSMISLIR